MIHTDRNVITGEFFFPGLTVGCSHPVILPVFLTGGDSQHNETEEATRQAGSGLRLCKDKVHSLIVCVY